MNHDSKRTNTYKMLRDEMMVLCERQDKYIIYMYTVTIACFTAAFATAGTDLFSGGAYWIFLIPVVLLVPIAFRVYDARKSVMLFGSYIYACLETKSVLDWEYMRKEYFDRPDSSKGKISIARLNALPLTVMGILFFWIYGAKKISELSVSIQARVFIIIILIMVQLACVICQGCISWKSSDKQLNDLRQDMIEKWSEIKNQVEAAETKQNCYLIINNDKERLKKCPDIANGQTSSTRRKRPTRREPKSLPRSVRS